MRELVLYDRSRVTTDWSCPRKRYWQYEFGEKGIVGSNTSLELYTGTILHDGLAAIAGQQKDGIPDIDLIATAARGQMLTALLADTSGEVGEVDFAHEQATLVEGLLRGFYRHVWPRLRTAYPTIVYIEEEMRFDHDGLTFMSRPDLVVADKDGNLWYLEYKSTSSKKEGWVNGWATAVQLHSTVRAIETTLGEKVTGVIVQGLYKGYESYGKQNSPFCYAYRRAGNPPFTQPDTRYEYVPGYKRFPVWDLDGGVTTWVANMPDDVLGDQFPQVPPIFVNEGLVNSFFQQRAYREHEIEMARDMLGHVPDEGEHEYNQVALLDAAFPQKFESCHPYFGRPCSYLRLCHGSVADPLQDGYTWREPHHALELDQQAADETPSAADDQ